MKLVTGSGEAQVTCVHLNLFCAEIS